MKELLFASIRLQDELRGDIEPYGVGLGDFEIFGKEMIRHGMMGKPTGTEYLTYKKIFLIDLKGYRKNSSNRGVGLQ